jgi:hypothetical protein
VLDKYRGKSDGRGKRYRSCERLPRAPLPDQLVILTTPCGGTMESRFAAERRPAMRDLCTMESRFAAERRPAMRDPCAMERRFAYNEPAYDGPVYCGPGYYPPHTSQHGTVQ